MIRGELNQLISKSGSIDLVVIDYLGLIEPYRHTKSANAEQQVRAISSVFTDKDGNIPSVEEIEGICSDVWVNGMMIDRCFDHPEIEFRKGIAKKDVEKVFQYLEELGYEVA